MSREYIVLGQVMFWVLLGCVGSWTYMWYCKDQAKRERERLPDLMSPRETVARYLFGEAVAWMPREMALFDHYLKVRAPWLDRADELLQARNQTCTSTQDPTRSTSSSEPTCGGASAGSLSA